MSALVATLTVALLLLGFSAVLAVYGLDRRRRRALAKRIGDLRTQRTADDLGGMLLPANAMATDADPRSYRFFGAGMSRRWGVHIGTGPLLVIAFVSFLSVWGIMGFLLRLPIALVLALSVGGGWLLPRTVMRGQQAKADRQFMELFPNAIDMIVRMIRAGLPVSAAIAAAGDEAPVPVGPVFKALAEEIGIGVPFEQALRAHAVKIGLGDFRFFAVAIALQKSTGGNLAVTLDTLGAIIRQRRSVRLKAHAKTGEERMSAMVLGGLPFFVTGGLLLTNPHYLSPLITDPRGHLIVGAAILSITAAWLIMRHMLNSIAVA